MDSEPHFSLSNYLPFLSFHPTCHSCHSSPSKCTYPHCQSHPSENICIYPLELLGDDVQQKIVKSKRANGKLLKWHLQKNPPGIYPRENSHVPWKGTLSKKNRLPVPSISIGYMWVLSFKGGIYTYIYIYIGLNIYIYILYQYLCINIYIYTFQYI